MAQVALPLKNFGRILRIDFYLVMRLSKTVGIRKDLMAVFLKWVN